MFGEGGGHGWGRALQALSEMCHNSGVATCYQYDWILLSVLHFLLSRLEFVIKAVDERNVICKYGGADCFFWWLGQLHTLTDNSLLFDKC